MIRLPEDARSGDAELPGFAMTLPAALSELRRSTEDLIEFFWDDMFRSHVCAQAAALAQAARLEGRARVFTLARAITSICFIPVEEAMPIRHEISDRLMELMELLGEAVRERRERTG